MKSKIFLQTNADSRGNDEACFAAAVDVILPGWLCLCKGGSWTWLRAWLPHGQSSGKEKTLLWQITSLSSIQSIASRFQDQNQKYDRDPQHWYWVNRYFLSLVLVGLWVKIMSVECSGRTWAQRMLWSACVPLSHTFLLYPVIRRTVKC